MAIKKGNKNKENEAYEVMFRKLQDKNFSQDILQLRGKFAIPSKSFSTLQEDKDWYINLKKDKRIFINYVDVLRDLVKKYNFPSSSNFYNLLEHRIRSNNKFYLDEDLNSTCDFDHDWDLVQKRTKSNITGTERLWRETKQPYVTIYISDFVNQKDVKNFIDKNWRKIRELLNKQRKSKRLVTRTVKNKKIKERIVRLCKLTRDQLGVEKNKDKFEFIGKKVAKEFGLNAPPSAKNVIAINKRYKGLGDI